MTSCCCFCYLYISSCLSYNWMEPYCNAQMKPSSAQPRYWFTAETCGYGDGSSRCRGLMSPVTFWYRFNFCCHFPFHGAFQYLKLWRDFWLLPNVFVGEAGLILSVHTNDYSPRWTLVWTSGNDSNIKPDQTDKRLTDSSLAGVKGVSVFCSSDRP